MKLQLEINHGERGHEHAQEATGKDKNTDLALDDRAGPLAQLSPLYCTG